MVTPIHHNRRATLVAAVVGLLVLFVGFVYAIARTPSYESTASLVLAPKSTTSSDALPGVMGGFTDAGTSGTFVELIASPDTLRAAGSPPISVSVRAVPDTRVIDVTASGDKTVVQPGLARLLGASEASQAGLGDVWQLKQIAAPSGAVQKGVGAAAIVLAAVLLALISAAATLALFGRLGGDASHRRSDPLPLEPTAPNGHEQHGAQAVREHVGLEG